MTFGKAVEDMQAGRRVTRRGWNCPNMWIAIRNPDSQSADTTQDIYIHMPHGDCVPWNANEANVLANDWELVP